jgi:hypothetical protein
VGLAVVEAFLRRQVEMAINRRPRRHGRRLSSGDSQPGSKDHLQDFKRITAPKLAAASRP